MRPRAASSRTKQWFSGLLTAAILVLLCGAPALAQTTTPEASAGAPTSTETPGGPTATPTVTRTPTVTPSPTPTFTALQAQLALGQAYLQGGDFAKAAEIFASVASEDRGNAEALAGLDAALKGQGSATATAAAPPVTVPPAATPAPAGPTFAGTLADRIRQFGAAALALLLAVAVFYLLARGVRWLLGWLREIWFSRVRRPPVGPEIVIGEFIDATGEESPASRLASQALSGQLAAWNAAVPASLCSPIVIDRMDRPGLAWLRTLWGQVFPPPRAYLLTGVLSGKQPGPYRLSLDRLDLRTDRIVASRTLESSAETPAQAFRELGAAAAFWARDPIGMERSPELLEMPARAPGLTGSARAAPQPTPTQVAGEVLKLLAQVRAQVTLDSVDHAGAPHILEAAQALLVQLPEGSTLRADLQTAAADLWRHVQPGRPGL